MLVQPKSAKEDDVDDMCSVKDEEEESDNNEDWMFRTFDKAKLCGKPSADR